jgi:hypothetical protein
MIYVLIEYFKAPQRMSFFLPRKASKQLDKKAKSYE